MRRLVLLLTLLHLGASQVPLDCQQFWKIYDQTGGPRWRHQPPFTRQQSCCHTDSSGLTIDCQEERIIYLRLANLGMTGTFPAITLSQLEQLDIDKSELRAWTPSRLPNLFSLSITASPRLKQASFDLSRYYPTLALIELSDCQFFGSMTDFHLNRLPQLLTVNLANNNFTGTLPDIAGMAIQSLDLSANHLTGTIPSIYGTLSSLNYLNLSDNQLRGTLPHLVLPQLHHLILDYNNLTGIPQGHLPALELAGLSHNYFAAIGDFTASKSLVQLRANNNIISVLDGRNFSHAKQVYLAHNRLTQDFNTLRLDGQVTIDLSFNRLWGELCFDIPGIQVNLRGNDLTLCQDFQGVGATDYGTLIINLADNPRVKLNPELGWLSTTNYGQTGDYLCPYLIPTRGNQRLDTEILAPYQALTASLCYRQ